jgi:23S rRNA pseudouridine1911/1915/1917 synthase
MADAQFIVEKESYLLEYLLLVLNNKSRKNIKSLLTRGNILVDGKVITQYNHKLFKGQKIKIQSKIYTKSNKEVLDIIYEDRELIVINKPSGLLSISTEDEKERTAYHMVMDYVKRNNPRNKVFVVHRLDRDTSGILLISKNQTLKHILQDKWDNIVLKRSYIAIVEGKPEETGTIKTWLRETKSLMVYSSNKKGDGKEAITHYKTIKSNEKYSMLDIKIDTGRKNQIRVHMNDIGHSVIGDKKYGAKTNPIKRLGLHAHILEFIHPITKKTMRFESQIPPEFELLFKKHF